ncbi:17.8 kDa class I heat shock protein-like [Euphorbia lathyris]|uniref:17.8 kDa class I heat shock protein-like n=1 Tax=Euphorbia lathyris TaxID=212925 RepID=UPI003313F0C0
MSLLHSVLNQIQMPDPIDGIWTPMNWRETSKAHIYEISLPGVTKEEVKLEVHQGSVLRIIAERKEEEEEGEEKGGIKWHCKERLNGEMKREFRLPENVISEEIKASMRDGLLVVIVPKDERKKKSTKLKSVDISGNDEGEDHRKGIGRFICCKA